MITEVFSLFGPPVLVCLIGLVGWKLAERLRFPAPAMIGPMLLVAVGLSLGVPGTETPGWLRLIVQTVIGAYIGRRLDRAALGSVVKMLPSVAVATSWYLGGTAVIGFVVARMAHIDMPNAFLATVPGGVAEMTAFAISTQADVAFVATLQALRVLASNMLIPFFARFGAGRNVGLASVRSTVETAGPPVADPAPTWLTPMTRLIPGGVENRKDIHWAFGLLTGFAGGLLFTLIGVPAGGVVGAMLAAAALRLAGFHPAPPPRILLNLSYLILGISVGLTFDPRTLARLQSSVGILVFATIATLASGLILALIVRRMMGLDFRTAMLACSPGGLSLMAVVAEETGAQSVIVSLFHLIRIVWVILVMPLFLRFLS